MSKDRTSMSRRRFLAFAGIGAAAAAVPLLPFAAGASDAATTDSVAETTCDVNTTQQEVGPFYVADGLVRSDVVSGEDGIPLSLLMTFTDADSCAALEGAYIDIWSANAVGVYSDEASEDTSDETYLRGIQQTDSSGKVTFSTIYPGWYAGRTEHVHFRAYIGGSVTDSTYDYTGATLVHTGQIFFDASTNATVAELSPYSSNTVARTLNNEDRVYTQQGGSDNVVTLTGDTTNGFTATISLASTTSTTEGSTDLSLKRSVEKLTAGSKLTLSGVLTDSSTSGTLGDQDVDIAATTASGATYTGTEITNGSGEWSLTFKPMRTAKYKATYDGDSSYDIANSRSESVQVAYRLLFTDIPGTGDADKPVKVTGSLTPADTGVVITLHELEASGGLRELTTAKTNVHGNWTAQFGLDSGTHHIKATCPTGEENLAGASRTIVLKRI